MKEGQVRRPATEKSKLIKEWVKQYGASRITLQKMPAEDFEQMKRMAEHARATIFSTLRWERENPNWRLRVKNSTGVKRTVPVKYSSRWVRPENQQHVRKMMTLVNRLHRWRAA